MKKLRKTTKRLMIFFIIFVAFIYLNNSFLFTEDRETTPILLAHRGLAQTFPMDGIKNDTCTAKRIYEPEHPYIENTIPSMEAAFKAGADIVEFDIQLTADGQFAVFHDWTLECRTNGDGVTREQTMAELKTLDVGYGYTADNGKTFPLRGKGVGLMPTLDEVLNYFREESFLIHIKSNDPAEGAELADYLSQLSKERWENLTVYGGDAPIRTLKEQLPELRVMSKASLKSCLLPYLAIGWTGYVPSPCQNTQIHLPENYAPFMWGWSNKFLNRMDAVDTRVIVVAGDGGWSEGFDTDQDLERLSDNFIGGIWTNRIDTIAPILSE